MLQIAFLVSGGGTNLQAVIDEMERNETLGEIKLVIANKPDAYALERAKKHNIATEVILYDENFSKTLLKTLKENKIDLVVLAGFLKILPLPIFEEYRNKIINIHPSLIPSFCGKGYYGLKVHEEVLKSGVKVTGATVHFVDENTDTGPIIMQKAVPVLEDDTPSSLQERVMVEAERIILPQAIKLIASGNVSVVGNKTKIKGV